MTTAAVETSVTVSIEERLSLMTRRDVVRRLKGHGIMGGTQSCGDYEMAKQVMFRGTIIRTPGVHARITRWIANYIGV